VTSDEAGFAFSILPAAHLTTNIVGIATGEHVVVKVVYQLPSEMKCCSFLGMSRVDRTGSLNIRIKHLQEPAVVTGMRHGPAQDVPFCDIRCVRLACCIRRIFT
jgi:hypothetical protein